MKSNPRKARSRTARLTLALVTVATSFLGIALSAGPAHAIIGRPLTPMSYAGVARRTTRRAVYAGAAYEERTERTAPRTSRPPPSSSHRGRSTGSAAAMTTVAGGEGGLALGGADPADPIDRLFRRAHVVRDAHGDVRRKAIVFILVTWCPLAVAALVERLVTGHVEPLFRDVSVHARLLVAMPLLLLAEALLRTRGDRVIERVHTRVAPATLQRIVHRCRLLRGAPFVDVALLAVAFATSHVAARGGALQLWYGVVALPLASFLLLRVSWSWIVWAFALASLSRVDLQANALHPDRCGGLRFLSRPTGACAVLVAAIAVVISSSWAAKAVAGTKSLSLSSTAPSLAILIAAALVVSVGPLLPFAAQLYRARVEGTRRYDELASAYSDAFRTRWMTRAPDDSLLGTGDIQSLADLGNAYEVVRRMQILPFGVNTLLVVVVAVLVPMLPLALWQVPFYDVLKSLLHLLLGRRLSA